MKKVLYVYGGPEFHPTLQGGKILSEWLVREGRFKLEMTSDLDAFSSLSNAKYSAVVVYTTGFVKDLTKKREKGLIDFVKNGGGFVGIHSASDSFRGSKSYIEMLGSEFLTHPEHQEFKVSIVEKNHYLTQRVPDFTVYDEMYHLQKFDAGKVTMLACTTWQGMTKPMAYVKPYGKGRVTYIANGHTAQAWSHPEFKKLLMRAVAWGVGEEIPTKRIRCGLLGYGPAFNMGKGHGSWINETPGLATVAMCDSSPARVACAKQEMPNLAGYFTNVDEMLKMKDLDLVVIILPHNLHAPMTLKCLESGKHVVLEKPFCITVKEANAMINTARSKKAMLSLFHNRRWDGDYLHIRDIVARGLIGEIFHIECGQAGYGHPGFWWRSDKKISGGVMYDWGAHFIDWILNLVPARITQVTGNFQKRVWNAVTNEDFGQVYIKFENGATADYLISNISASSRPKWRINGTKGSIESNPNGDLTLISYVNGIRQESVIKLSIPGYGCTQYYRTIADHLLMGEELAVKPEQARRVIGVIEAGQISSAKGTSVAPVSPCENDPDAPVSYI